MSTATTGGSVQAYWWNVFQQKRALGEISDNKFLHLHGDWSSLHLEEPDRVLIEEKVRKHIVSELLILLVQKRFDIHKIDVVLTICETTEDLARDLADEISCSTGKKCESFVLNSEYKSEGTALFVDGVVDLAHLSVVNHIAERQGIVLAPFVLALSDGGYRSISGVREIISLVQEVPR